MLRDLQPCRTVLVAYLYTDSRLTFISSRASCPLIFNITTVMLIKVEDYYIIKVT